MSVHTTSHVLRRRLALGSLLPVLALTAACGGGDEATDASSSSESSESAETSDQPYDADTIIPAMQEALGDETSARIQMELTGQAELSIDGSMAMTDEFEDGEMELTVDVQGQALEMRQVDGLIYVSGPPATPEGKWLEVDPSDPKDPVAQQFAGLAKSGDLTTTFDAFREGAHRRRVRRRGGDRRRGDRPLRLHRRRGRGREGAGPADGAGHAGGAVVRRVAHRGRPDAPGDVELGRSRRRSTRPSGASRSRSRRRPPGTS